MVTGKPVGQDLRDGKATLLLALAGRRGGESAATRIAELTSIGTDEALGELRHLLEATGARQEVEREITLLAEQASRALGTDLVAPVAVDLLRRLGRAATTYSSEAAQPPMTHHR